MNGHMVAFVVVLLLVVWAMRRKTMVAYVPPRIPPVSWSEPDVAYVPKRIPPEPSWWSQVYTPESVAGLLLVGAGGLAYLYWQREAELRRLEKMYGEFYEEEIPRNPEQLRAFRAEWKELMDEW